MSDDSPDAMVRIGYAAVVLQLGENTSRFTAHTASLSVPQGSGPVRLRLEGPRGSVSVELSRVAFWRLTSEFHERSIASDDPSSKPMAQRTRRVRS
jgi:hypothetical protein